MEPAPPEVDWGDPPWEVETRSEEGLPERCDVAVVGGGFTGLTAAWAHVTNRDLSKFGSLLFMGLIGIILASVVNIFFSSSILYTIITYAGVLLFVGLTAYDTQQLKRLGQSELASGESGQKLAILGALKLYLDFINLFLFMLRLMGNRR